MLPVDNSKKLRTQEWFACREKTLAAHISGEESHDIDAIMATYAPNAEVVFNGQIFYTFEQIRNLHLALGFSSQGALPDISYILINRLEAGEVIVIEYRIKGTHQGEFAGIQPTGKKVEMAATVIYEFDDVAKLKSERVYIDIAPLFQ